jgi:hypothetical protein
LRAHGKEATPLSRRRPSDGELRVADRWLRADEAPRLSQEIPNLKTLRLSVEEWRGGGEIPGSTHVRLFVVSTAPAFFLVPCGDPRCKDGGHDITHEIMSALRSGTTQFQGEYGCGGSVGGGECSRLLRYTVTATYG